MDVEQGRRVQCIELMTKVLAAKPDFIAVSNTGSKAAQEVIDAAEKLRKYIYPKNP